MPNLDEIDHLVWTLKLEHRKKLLRNFIDIFKTCLKRTMTHKHTHKTRIILIIVYKYEGTCKTYCT